MSKLWDDMLKRMFTANPQHFLNWLVPNAVLLHELSSELKTPSLSDLKAQQPETRDLTADMLYVILWYGVKTILHIEFQRRGDKQMGKRLWQYNSTTTINKGLPVSSIVIYLRKDRKIEEPPYLEKLPNGRPNHIFLYEAVKLWELPAEVFLQSGMEGLLPLVTLTHDGKRREVVDEMITRLVASHNHNLLSMAFNFAALVYDKPDEQAWLIERFEMYKKDLEESYIYQKILKEGREAGREEGREEGREVLRETFVGFLNARYPMLVELAQEQISGITEIKQLQEILNRVFYLQTAGEIEEYLLSLHDDATKN
jgi:predicted transposase YdaD